MYVSLCVYARDCMRGVCRAFVLIYAPIMYYARLLQHRMRHGCANATRVLN